MISFILFLMCLMLMTLTALSLAGMLFTLLSGGDPDRMAELVHYIRGLLKRGA